MSVAGHRCLAAKHTPSAYINKRNSQGAVNVKQACSTLQHAGRYREKPPTANCWGGWVWVCGARRDNQTSAHPKSASFALIPRGLSGLAFSSTFAGLRSQCISPRPWMCSKLRAMSSSSCRTRMYSSSHQMSICRNTNARGSSTGEPHS